MKKLLKGIVEFRQNHLRSYQEKFARLAKGQSPDTLFVTCSDSRVAPNWFASTDPGDLFVMRNVGNLIPLCASDGRSTADESEAAAIEFALLNLNVNQIIVCGHSDCGAMQALLKGREKVAPPNLRAWLRHGEASLEGLPLEITSDRANELSRLNVLHQLENLRSYPIVKERLADKKVTLHAWWFDLSSAGVSAYESDVDKFVLIDEQEAARILARLS